MLNEIKRKRFKKAFFLKKGLLGRWILEITKKNRLKKMKNR